MLLGAEMQRAGSLLTLIWFTCKPDPSHTMCATESNAPEPPEEVGPNLTDPTVAVRLRGSSSHLCGLLVVGTQRENAEPATQSILLFALGHVFTRRQLQKVDASREILPAVALFVAHQQAFGDTLQGRALEPNGTEPGSFLKKSLRIYVLAQLELDLRQAQERLGLTWILLTEAPQDRQCALEIASQIGLMGPPELHFHGATFQELRDPSSGLINGCAQERAQRAIYWMVDPHRSRPVNLREADQIQGRAWGRAC